MNAREAILRSLPRSPVPLLDIEGVIIHGAQGASSLTVVLVASHA
jgi:hypothetical protein